MTELSRKLAERDYARLELADMAREIARMERDAKRAEDARRRSLASTKRAALAMPTEQLVTWGIAAGATAEAAEVAAMAEAAEAMGVTAAELAEQLAVERALVAETSGRNFKRTADVGQYSTLAPAEAAAVADWTSEALASKAAEAGRVALAAMGQRAAGLVVTAVGSEHLTIAKVVTVASVERAVERAAKLAEQLAEARAKLATAERAVKLAEATKAVKPLRAANAEADRIAAAVAKLATKLATAEAAAGAAELAEAAGLVAVPVATLELAEAAEAAVLELAERADAMPVGMGHRGPAARHTVRPVSDPTGNEAAANADGAAEAIAAAGAAEAKRAVRTLAAVAVNGRPVNSEAQRTEYKARRAMAAKNRRRAAKLANN